MKKYFWILSALFFTLPIFTNNGYAQIKECRSCTFNGLVCSNNSCLNGADLYGTKLLNVTINGADFSKSELRNIVVKHSTLKKAIFRNVNLAGSQFYKVDLSGSMFDGAKLPDVLMWGVNLTKSNVSQSQLNDINGDLCTKIPKGLKRPQTWYKDCRRP